MNTSDLEEENHIREYSAIVVLANLMDEHGNLNDESRSRMDKTIEA